MTCGSARTARPSRGSTCWSASMVFSAIALALTYLPILVVANDPEYMGDQVNDVATTAAGVFYRITIVVASLASVPLLIIAGAGS